VNSLIRARTGTTILVNGVTLREAEWLIESAKAATPRAPAQPGACRCDISRETAPSAAVTG